ncbi:MAG TPA: energy transducer TonB [Allosphingosinicella sp.]
MILKLSAATASLLVAASAQNTASEPKPSTPLGRLISSADYPAAAVRAGEQGNVEVQLGINADGRVTDCRIVESSRSAALDSATCRLLVSRSRFQPARDEAGRAIASTYNTRIRWALPAGPPPVLTTPASVGSMPSMMSVIRMDLQPDGAITNCTVQVGPVGATAPMAARPCPAEPPPPPVAELLRSRAPLYRTLRIVGITAREGKEVPEALRSEWGERLNVQTSDIEVDEKGRPVKCTSILHQPPVATGPSHCAMVEARQAREPSATNGAAVTRLRIENSVYGIRR